MVSVLAPRHRSGSGLLWDGEKRRPFQSCHRSFGRNSLLTSTFQSRPLSHLQQRATISFRSSLSIIAAMPWVEASETSAVASRLSHYLAQHDLNIRHPATRKHRHTCLLPAVNYKLLEGRVRVFCAFPTFFTLTIKMDQRKQLCTLTPGSDRRQLFSCS